MELYEKTFLFQFTELWFKWLGWILLCVGLEIFASKSESLIAYLFFFLSSGLVAYSIGSTAIDIAFNTFGKSKSKFIQFGIALSVLLNPILLVILFSTLKKMLLGNV